MQHHSEARNLLTKSGFLVIENVYGQAEIGQLITILDNLNSNKPTFRKTTDLFAIRKFLKEVPEVKSVIFNTALLNIIKTFAGDDYFIVKSIYFDKPPTSNWFVAWHQDLTISVKSKVEVEGFGPWTVKQDQYSVQPPLPILERNLTVRIHLDDTDEQNGALKVIPGSHLKGIVRRDGSGYDEEVVSVMVPAGGIMLMKPLLMHASGRTTNNSKRRVIHIEFSNQRLPEPLHWAEWDVVKSPVK